MPFYQQYPAFIWCNRWLGVATAGTSSHLALQQLGGSWKIHPGTKTRGSICPSGGDRFLATFPTLPRQRLGWSPAESPWAWELHKSPGLCEGGGHTCCQNNLGLKSNQLPWSHTWDTAPALGIQLWTLLIHMTLSKTPYFCIHGLKSWYSSFIKYRKLIPQQCLKRNSLAYKTTSAGVSASENESKSNPICGRKCGSVGVYFKGDSTGFVAPNHINNISVKKCTSFVFILVGKTASLWNLAEWTVSVLPSGNIPLTKKEMTKRPPNHKTCFIIQKQAVMKVRELTFFCC